MRNARDLNFKIWPSSKRPPLKLHRRGLQYPIRLEPVDDIVMTTCGDKTNFLFAYIFLRRMRRDLRYLTIDYGRELVHDDRVLLQESSCELDTESLPIRENAIGSEP